MEKIYVKDFSKEDLSSLKSLINILYTDPVHKLRMNCARVTFQDAACIKQQCHAARRSFEDLLILARTYFPRTTQKSLMKVLQDLKLKLTFCKATSKIVFHQNGERSITLMSFQNPYVKNFHYVEGTFTATKLATLCKQLK